MAICEYDVKNEWYQLLGSRRRQQIPSSLQENGGAMSIQFINIHDDFCANTKLPPVAMVDLPIRACLN
jgi:hypothetical protein